MDKNFKGKKVLIFGLGLNQGGLGAAKIFAQAGAIVKVTDLKSRQQLEPSLKQLKKYRKIKYTLGKHLKKDFDWADLIIKNPKITPSNKFLKYAFKKKKQIETDMGIFLQFVSPKQIVGVTGTKGKSTTSSLIYSALKLKFKNVIHAGNIGTSVLDVMPKIKENTLVVLELSSFHLEAFDENKLSPKWAVITNIYPDHLDYYKTFDRYVESKRIIVKYQQPGDCLFINRADKLTGASQFLKRINSKIVFFSKDDLPKPYKPYLIGEHNLENIAATLSVAKAFNIDSEKTLRALAKFKGVDFRLQLVKTAKRVKIYNDSAATVPYATIEALKSLPNSVLIVGGKNKGLQFKDLAKAIDKYAKKVYFLEGDATNLIKRSLKSKKKVMGTFNNLEPLLKAVKQNIKAGDTILFSPGATSFNLFQNEFERGRKFNAAVQKVFH